MQLKDIWVYQMNDDDISANRGLISGYPNAIGAIDGK